MNKERRALIAKAMEQINEARSMLEQARDEEGDYFEAMPEPFKESDRGRATEDGLDKLSEVLDTLENLDDLSDL